jgi:4-amino-4-deoxy-L-arabinose transferase-like glycosyltransferase
MRCGHQVDSRRYRIGWAQIAPTAFCDERRPVDAGHVPEEHVSKTPSKSKPRGRALSGDLGAASVDGETVVNSSAQRLDQWLSRRQRYIVAGIVVLSLVVRVVYFVQLNAGPLVHQHKWDQSDMNHFDNWARQIAAGDWLSRHVAVPLHLWHLDTAAEYYRQHASEQAAVTTELTDESSRRDRAQALWEEWCGKGKLYQEPLYPYLVAITYKFLGPDVRWVFIWQMLLGTASNVLVYLIAKRCFGSLAGTLGALFAVLYAPLMMYEMVLLRETTIVFATLALAYMAMITLDRTSPWRWAAAGLAFGVSLTLKSQFWLVLAGFVAIAAFSMRRRRVVAIHRVGMLVLGSAVGFAPVVIRNLGVGAPAFMTASGGAPTFALGNAVGAGANEVDRQHVAQIMGQSQGRLLQTIMATFRTHPSVTGVLWLMGEKLLAMWHWYEWPTNENFYLYRLHAGILRWLPLTYGYLAPVGLVGLLVALRRLDKALAVLYVVMLANIAVMLLSSVYGRFRLPMAALLLPFIGFVAARFVGWLAAGQWARAVSATAAVGLLAVWVGRPTDTSVAMIRCADCTVPYQVYYNPKIEAACKAQSWLAVTAILFDSLRYEPDDVRRLSFANRACSAEEKCLAELYIRKRQILIYALDAQGRNQEADVCRRRVKELLEALPPSGSSPLSGNEPKQLDHALGEP